jgi:hypothetical protein
MSDNSIHASIHASDKEVGKKAEEAKIKKAETSVAVNWIKGVVGKNKDNAIHASIHKDNSKIG